MSRGLIIDALSYLQAFAEEGYHANMGECRRDRMVLGGKHVGRYSYSVLLKPEGKLPQSIRATAEMDIPTSDRHAASAAQMEHESKGLAIFSRVPANMRAQLERQKQIADLAYGGRYGNRGTASGDGWRYRGRGLKQITFHDNHAACGRALGVDLVASPDLLVAARSAGWFWKANGCNALADKGDFAGTTRAINGPAMDGQDKRVAFWGTAKSALGLA